MRAHSWQHDARHLLAYTVSMQRILIIGGAGFIGVTAARHFLRKQFDVTILDNFSRKGTEFTAAQLQKEYPNVRIIRADVRTDQGALEKAVGAADLVLHLAAQVAVTTSITDPRNDFEQNALGTFNVLEAVRTSKNKPALIYSSTNKVYGSLEHLTVQEKATRYEFTDANYREHGVPESEQLDFHSPYGCSKGTADQYVIDYGRIYGLRTLVFRQSCIYGENQFGVEDQGWVAWFTIAAMLGKPLTLYGTGKQVRDILFAEDLVELYDTAFQKIDTFNCRAYNVGGSPKNTLSLLELIEALKREGYTLAPSRADTRPGDQPIFVADIRAAERDFGWHPKVGVEEGMKRMHEWLRTNEATVRQVLGS